MNQTPEHMRSAIAIDAITALETFGVTRASRHLVGELLPMWARWTEMGCEDIEAVHDYFRPWGDTPRETLPTDADRIAAVRELCDRYKDTPPPAFLDKHGDGYAMGMRVIAAAVLDVLDGDTADLGDVASGRTPLPTGRAAGQWRAANDGAGKMRWFLIRETPGSTPEYHYGANDRLVRYGSFEAASKEADRLNAAQLTATPLPTREGHSPASRDAYRIIRRQDDEGGVA